MKQLYLQTICLPVRDHERAKSFYVQVLGFVVVRDVRGGPEHHRWIEVGPKDAETSIALVDASSRKSVIPIEGLVLRVSDLKAYRAELQTHGVRPSAIVDEDWGSHLSLYDPDGNRWIVVDHDTGSVS